MKIRTVLIANRGEIACRIIRTCKRLGIKTVAIYSEPDRDALHRRLADIALPLDGSESSDTYLTIKKIISIAKANHVDAVHPGYGFLSENPLFADALSKAKIKLIGPSATTMRALGDKIRAKAIAKRCKVPTIPSLILTSSTGQEKKVSEFGKKYGYPLLIKASAGGGGRGMRRLDSSKEIKAALAAASREAKAFFNDGRVFVEKLLLNPRHIEVQLLGDSQGNVVHLYDRDCTMQRRHQKVIEEAPAPHLPEQTRKAILSSAKKLAEEVRYENAGTAEFLLDRENNFYFLEVNSRLQVEHPVSEEITGLDLVELQIRVAQAEPLSKIFSSGVTPYLGNTSIEVRVCAEDPAHGFAPSTGRIEAFVVPESSSIRVETGVEGGSVISHFYDPLIAKIIATGATRDDVIQNLLVTLKKTVILGPTSNIPFLISLLESSPFRSVSHDTKIAESLTRSASDSESLLFKIAAFAVAAQISRNGVSDPWSELKGFRIASHLKRSDSILIRNTEFTITTDLLAQHLMSCRVVSGKRQERFDFALELRDGATLSLRVNDDNVYELVDSQIGSRSWLTLNGESFEICRKKESRAKKGHTAHSGILLAPLPGKVLQIKAKPKTKVKAGDAVIVIESMKMEHAIVSPWDGIVESISVKIGGMVDAGALLGKVRAR